MSVVYVVLPLAVLLAIIALAAFAWSLRSGQLDDLDTPSIRLLLEDDEAPEDHDAGDQTSELTTGCQQRSNE